MFNNIEKIKHSTALFCGVIIAKHNENQFTRDGALESLWQNVSTDHIALAISDPETVYDVLVVGGGITGLQLRCCCCRRVRKLSLPKHIMRVLVRPAEPVHTSIPLQIPLTRKRKALLVRMARSYLQMRCRKGLESLRTMSTA